MDLSLPPVVVSWFESVSPPGWVNAPWAMPAIETVHAVALLVLVSAIAVIDLRMLGLVNRRRTVAAVAVSAAPYIYSSLTLFITTGFLNFISRPVRYSQSAAPLLTSVLFGAALISHFTVVRRATGAAELPSVSFRKLAAYVSLALWLGVAVAERAFTRVPWN